MTRPDPARIRREAAAALGELFSRRRPRGGELLVLGCSTSAVLGEPLGKASDPAVGEAVVAGMREVCDAAGVVLAVQGCEHVNRALVVPADLVEEMDLVPVNIVPTAGAGGAAPRAWHDMLGERAAVVEDLGRGADYGLDVGGVLIGMHLRRDRVAVPVHISARIGAAPVAGAFSRLKWVGGPRTRPGCDDR